MTTATFAPTKQLTPEQEARHALAVELAERNIAIREAIAHSKLEIIRASINLGELGCFSCGYVAPASHFEPWPSSWQYPPNHLKCPWCSAKMDWHGWVDDHGHLHDREIDALMARSRTGTL